MDLFKHSFGPELSVSGEVVGAELHLTFERVSPSGSESFVIKESLKYFIDKEKDKLPAWAQPLIAMGEAALP